MVLSNSGQGGPIYPEYVTFHCEEMRHHLEIYVLKGIFPTLGDESKFKPQLVENIYVNGLVYLSLGPSTEIRHRHFKFSLLHRILHFILHQVRSSLELFQPQMGQL